MKQEEIEKIQRFIDNQVDDGEKEWFETLFLNGEDNSALRNSLEKDWTKTVNNESSSYVNLTYLLDRIHHRIRKNELKRMQRPLRRFARIYMQAAAILLFPLLIAGGLVYSYIGLHGTKTTNQLVRCGIYAPLGARVSFNLPDGTCGMLNSGSTLSYSLPFYDNRQVKLEGEAWFEVNHDEKHPFEISTGNSAIKVLGTSFNVSAYPIEKYVEVVLENGELEFVDNTKHEKVTMHPSERLVFSNGNIAKSVTDPTKYSAWTEGKLVFRGDPMTEVANRIERWYNVKVVLADKELEKYSFRGTFVDNSLEDVLRFLSMTSPIRYRIIHGNITQDGTFKKEEVTIYLK